VTTRTSSRFPNLGKLSIALLEHVVEPFIGKGAIAEVKDPLLAKQETDKVISAIVSAEKRFKEKGIDDAICQALVNLSVGDLPSAQQAMVNFFHRPNDNETLTKALLERFAQDFPTMPSDRREAAVFEYVAVLREELLNVSTEIREKLTALATLRMQASLEQLVEAMNQFVKLSGDQIVFLRELPTKVEVALQSAKPLTNQTALGDVAKVESHLEQLVGINMSQLELLKVWLAQADTRLLTAQQVRSIAAPVSVTGIPDDLSTQQKFELVDLLLECASLQNRYTRDSIVKDLPDEIRSSLERSMATKPDLINIVTGCLLYSGGLKAFLDIVYVYEGRSKGMKKAGTFLSQL